MRLQILLFSLIVPALAQCQFISTDGTPTAEQATNNVCIDITATPRRVYMPGGLSLGTIDDSYDISLQSLTGWSTMTIGMPQSDGRNGGGPSNIAISAQEPAAGVVNLDGGYLYINAGASHGTNSAAVVIGAPSGGADGAGANAAVGLLAITGRPAASISPSYMAGVWLGGGVRFAGLADMVLTNGVNNDVDLLTTDGKDSVFYEVSGPTGDFSIAGFALNGASPSLGGFTIIVVNNTAYNMTLEDESPTSCTICRIVTGTGADRATTGQGLAALYYSTSLGRWRVLWLDA